MWQFLKMGYVAIPKIDIKIPVYHTVKDEGLDKAAGHLEGSSLPAGGESTHSVISAHRGLPSAALFTDLDKLKEGDHFLLYILDDILCYEVDKKEGDHFLLYILDDILCYEVDKISVVEPDDTKDLEVEEGKEHIR